MKEKITYTIPKSMDNQLIELYPSSVDLTFDFLLACKKVNKRKTPIPLKHHVHASITRGICLDPEDVIYLDKLRGDISRSIYVRSLIEWMLSLESITSKRQKHISKTENLDASTLFTSIFSNLDNQLRDLALLWNTNRDHALLMAISYTHENLIK